MKDIKFRAFCKHDIELNQPLRFDMVHDVEVGETFFRCAEDPEINYTPICVFADPENWFLQQYTGLKDKNGTEIYEGDVVHLNHWKSSDLFDYSSHFVVEYYEGEINFKQGEYNNLKGSLNGKIDIEVIGNIYQNPELLNKPDSPYLLK